MIIITNNYMEPEPYSRLQADIIYYLKGSQIKTFGT